MFKTLIVWTVLVIAAPPVLALSSDYPLASGDIVEFDLLDDDALPLRLTVTNDGRIWVPLLGAIEVNGLYVAEALEELRKEFVQQNLLVKPNISLTVAVYRPIFVLGDVRNPGSFPFQPLLTVEQAVGMAGGPLKYQGTLEDPELIGARLRGELEQLSADITRAAIAVAQARSKLNNAVVIADSDIPEEARSYLQPTLSQELRQMGQRLLGIEKQAFDVRKALLTEGISEAEQQLEIFGQSIANQKEVIKLTRVQLERSSSLLKKGLTVANEPLQLQSQMTAEEGRLLTIYSEMSDARQLINTLKRELSQIEELRKREALTSIQEHDVSIQKLMSQRRSVEEQLFLMTNIKVKEVGKDREISIEYKIRHRNNNSLEDQLATNTTFLSPGDVVLVSREKSETTAGALQ